MNTFKKYFLSLSLVLIIFISGCDKEVSVSPPEPPLPTGKLYVVTDPDSAKIFINGKFTGNLTPDTIPFLENRTYQVLLKKQYFKNIVVDVNISADSLSNLFIDYKTYPGVSGNIKLDSDPRGAHISIDDTATGRQTPYTFYNLFPGIHEVTLKREGYWDITTNFKVESGKTNEITFALPDSLVWVNFNPSNSGLPDININYVAIDNNNIKWIGTVSNGLVSFDDKNWTIYNSSNSPLTTDNIRFIGIDSQNKKWICTQFGLVSFDGTNWVTFTSQNSDLPSDWINCIDFDLNGNKWIGTPNGLAKFDDVNWTIYNGENSPIHYNTVETITADNEGNVWIGTTQQGMIKFDGNTSWTIYNSRKAGFPLNAAGGIAFDNNGIIWVGVAYRNQMPGGVAFSEDHFNFTNLVGIPSNDVRGIVIDKNDNKWFANGFEGMSKYDGSKWRNYTMSTSKIPSNIVLSIAIDHSGYKWIATYDGGLSKYKGD